jgi:hypothetical protein
MKPTRGTTGGIVADKATRSQVDSIKAMALSLDLNIGSNTDFYSDGGCGCCAETVYAELTAAQRREVAKEWRAAIRHWEKTGEKL